MESYTKNKVAGLTGIEPAISGLTGRRDNHLRYSPRALFSFHAVFHQNRRVRLYVLTWAKST